MSTTTPAHGPRSMPGGVATGTAVSGGALGRRGDAPAPLSAQAVAPTHAVMPVQRGRLSSDPVDEQLARLEARLMGEVADDPVASMAVRSHLAVARARFADATVTHFLPILVEREVRRRMREDAGSR